MVGDGRLKGELVVHRPWDKKATFSTARSCVRSRVICLLPQQQQRGLTVVCWMWHRGVVLQMTVGVVGYVGGEAVAPRPG